MKHLFSIFTLCLAMISVGSLEVQAQAAGKAAQKFIGIISKGAKKVPKKTISTRKTPVQRTSPKPRPRPTTTVTCSQCNGNGTMTYWSSYAGQYKTIRCSKCNGNGRIRKY